MRTSYPPCIGRRPPTNGTVRRERLVLIFLLVLVSLYAAARLDWVAYPAEDAAMLLRYADHLADGHGLVWNVGEDPVEGATSFLFVIAIAALKSMGLESFSAARALGLAFHLMSVSLIYLASRRILGADVLLSLTVSAYFGIGPGLRHLEVGFGSPVFAFFATVLFVLGWRLALHDDTLGLRIQFALAGVLTGMTRPEGVFLFCFVLAAVVVYRGPAHFAAIVSTAAAIFAVVGGAYFLWRYSYFGYPFPNAFYKKGGGALYYQSLVESAKNMARMSLPFLVVASVAMFHIVFVEGRSLARALRPPDGDSPPCRWLAFLALPIVGFTSIWLLLSNEMNYFARFQYPILGGTLIALASVIWPSYSRLRVRVASHPRSFRGVAVVLALLTLGYQHEKMSYSRPTKDGKYDIAKMLREYEKRGYTMAVSEAGLLPWVSGWRAIDTWGLNDETIAHAGGIDIEYLTSQAPEIIMFHAYFSPMTPAPVEDDWDAMTKVLDEYASANDYVLAAVFGIHADDTHYYYVRRDFIDSATIVDRIRGIPYRWPFGSLCQNYALPADGLAGVEGILH